jgi:benzoate membrane transport protein
MAAISAAICTGHDAHPDPKQRWLTGPFYALCYLVFAIFGASLVAIFAVLPPALIMLIAGLGLIGPFINALALALNKQDERFAAIITFAVTASGITILGIGSAFWALIAGLIVAGMDHLSKNR